MMKNEPMRRCDLRRLMSVREKQEKRGRKLDEQIVSTHHAIRMVASEHHNFITPKHVRYFHCYVLSIKTKFLPHNNNYN